MGVIFYPNKTFIGHQHKIFHYQNWTFNIKRVYLQNIEFKP